MTREEAKRRAELYSALAEGKTIRDWTNDTWKDKEYTSFGELSQSPIKPQPKYRPFKSQEECWQEMHKHPDFGWVKGNATGEYKQVICISGYKAELIFNVFYGSPAYHSSKMMFSSYTFTDGTPFGIKEE